MTVAAFCAVASTPHTYNGERVTPEALALPPAVLVHEGHEVEALAAGPVAVALPMRQSGAVVITAVFSSAATEAAKQVRRGQCSVSIVATAGYGSPAEYRFGILTAVDLVPVGGDPGARITSTIDTADLSPDLRRCRAAFDAYLANLANPQQLDLLDRVHRLGLRAFDPLASVVAGIRDHYQAQSAKRQADMAAVRAMVRGHRASTSLLAPAMAAHSRSKVDRAITPSPTTHLRPSQ